MKDSHASDPQSGLTDKEDVPDLIAYTRRQQFAAIIAAIVGLATMAAVVAIGFAFDIDPGESQRKEVRLWIASGAISAGLTYWLLAPKKPN